ncbi:VrrA/YqfQ family protein [Ureibacillus sinduriensis]|uniref:VrrA/YqfQ family protein n=1 Tax=Ureibacillus sinduriensis TaxID=561440 RepID=UPI001BFFD669|nr:VrrA/YqfQ family protein [Ureibacillus sinduriensis]
MQSFMDTANRFLATAQSFQPLVQQATPMFRNLPALWRLYKGFQGLPKASDSKEDDLEEDDFDFDESTESLESPEVFARPQKAIKEKRPERPVRPARPKNFDRPATSAKRNRYKEYEISESPTFEEKVRPKKISTRPSIPRIFQPPYHFDE